jgi:hypothetical protein
MTSISSTGNLSLPAAQPARRQAERSVQATETKLTVQQEQEVQGAGDKRSRGSSEQAKAVIENTSEKQTSPSVTQADIVKSAGEQQKNEAAQQEAQRAEFDQQAGIVRKTEPNDVRPPSSDNTDNPQPDNSPQVELVALQENSPAIEVFKQLQNINADPRQGKGINQFA